MNLKIDTIIAVISMGLAMTFFASTGTPAKDKKIIFYDSGHWPLPRNQMIKESLDFIDKYTVE